MVTPPRRSTLFPYTTLFRSGVDVELAVVMSRGGGARSLGLELGARRHFPHRDGPAAQRDAGLRSEEHTSELQSRFDLVCRRLLEKKNPKPSMTVDVSATFVH